METPHLPSPPEIETPAPCRRARVLIVDDDDHARELMRLALRGLDAELHAAENGRQAIEILKSESFDLILCDQRMPLGVSGMDVLHFAQTIRPTPPLFILVTGQGTVDMAVEAMRAGAVNFVEKPFEVAAFQDKVSKALQTRILEAENRALRQAVEAHYLFPEIIGASKAWHDALDLARRAAEQNSPVLLLGESGTGKDLVARAIHFHGPRHKNPFVAINCGAIPENLIESELFGHKKGAFTGASADRRGCFEEAAGGTLFLDEIGEMRLDLQVRLLRVIEEHKVRRVGENLERPVDFRIIAATNRALEELVEEGRFRKDLYYRLNVLYIHR